MASSRVPSRRVSRRGRILGAVLFLAALNSCSGSDGPTAKISVPDVQLGPASNADGVLRPGTDGFSFANFAAANTAPEVFGGADLAAMFGSGPEVCSSGSDDTCVPTKEAAEWAQMVNDSRETGHCEGFIVLALQRFASKEPPSTGTLSSSANVYHGIFRGFAAQFLDSTRAESRAWRKQSVQDVVKELVAGLKDGVPDHVLGLYSEMGGHAVLPYSVTFADAEHASIGIYDSNWPGQERRVSVDLAAGTWRFSFDGSDPDTDESAWTGGKGDIDLSSLDSHTNGTCPFCDSITTTTTPTMLAIRASAPTWALATARGTVTPKGEPVDGTSVSKVRAVATKTNEWLVTVDADVMKAKSVRLTLPKGAHARVVTPNAVARAVASNTPADFDLTESSITTTSKNASVYLANGDKDVSARNKEATLSLTDKGIPVSAAAAATTPATTATTATRTTNTTARTSTTSPVTTAATATTAAPSAQTTTTASPATAAPATTAVAVTTTTTVAPTTTAANQRPNVNATACTGSASTVTLTLSVSDPENDAVTGPTFAFVSGPTNPINPTNWSSPSATAPYTWHGNFSTPYAPIVLDITISDAGGPRTVRKTLSSSNNSWNGSGTCSVA